MQEQFEATIGRPMQVTFRHCQITRTKTNKINKQTKKEKERKKEKQTRPPDRENRSPQLRVLSTDRAVVSIKTNKQINKQIQKPQKTVSFSVLNFN